MLIPRDELRFDFQGATFDTRNPQDRKFLGWVFDQFLYGEVTGIQCGHWLYRAPHLQAATFLAKQASEELSHVKRILRIQTLLGEKPGRAHGAIRFLSTGMMGGTWGEHVALEMALGEGLVLTVFYALADTIPDPEIKKLIESAIGDEERHVTFGEKETIDWLQKHPRDRETLLAQAMFQIVALKRIKNFVLKNLSPGHPVLGRFGAFYDHTLAKFEKRVELLGLYPGKLSELGVWTKLRLIALMPIRSWISRLTRKNRLLTDTYLNDPWVRSPSAVASAELSDD